MANKLSNKKTFGILIADGRPFGETVKYLLACRAESLKGIAILANVAAPVVSQTIYGVRINRKVVTTISKILGFNPWTFNQ